MPQGQEPVQAGFVAGDPFFDRVSLLMHFDGADMGTVFTQHQLVPIALSRNSGDGSYPATRTAQKLFGTAAAYFSDSKTNLYSDDATAWDISGDFTVETAFYTGVKDNNHGIVDLRVNASGGGPLIETTDSGSGTLRFRLAGNTVAETSAISNNTWHRAAMSRVDGTVFSYLDGQLIGSAAVATTHDCLLTIGTYIDKRGSVSYGWNGYLDELRITRGIGRYSGSSYPLATEPFPNY